MTCCGPQSHEYQPLLFQSPRENKNPHNDEESYQAALSFYMKQCEFYGSKPQPSVIVAVRYKMMTFKAARDFKDIDMLAFADLMLKHPKEVRHVRHIDLSYSKVALHGSIALAEVLKTNQNIEAIHLHGLKISGMGAEALAYVLGTMNRSVKYVDMRACRIGQAGGLHIAKYLLSNEDSVVKEMDLSVNNIGNEGLVALREAINERNRKRSENEGVVLTHLDLEGNLVLEEVLNSITHGVGILMSIVASVYLLGRASEYGIEEHVAAAMYSSSLLLLYTSSTLYHAFFCCKATNRIFQTLDHSAIYLLIAGTYTPVLMLALPDNYWSLPLLYFQWICCMLGLIIEFLEFTGKVQLTLVMYVLMGWSVLICFDDLTRNVSEEGIYWLVVGGVFYTGGVPFFLAQFHMSHVIWHMFVLAGSISQWWAVYQYVMPLDLRHSRGQNIAYAHAMKEEIGHVFDRTMDMCADLTLGPIR
uniref:Uncharacterized protein n=1 Tax=Lotharella globosa TaxID=91324 RepID=A0A6V3R996_9EUKA|mmetsp:Transcript_27378/g.53111  ORF Transcript_27378/g.53111 Transcript_27378/m.53111 type:complete len:473 (-) Transcript_27378:115-1533(-)